MHHKTECSLKISCKYPRIESALQAFCIVLDFARVTVTSSLEPAME